MTNHAKKLVIFDLDGTLINTIDDVCICFNRALVECGYPGRSEVFISSLIGLPLEEIIGFLLPDRVPNEEIMRVSAAYKNIYASFEKPKTKPYPGVPGVLRKLKERGVHVAVNSNKAHEIACNMVSTIFPEFDLRVFGYGRVTTSKPSPEAVYELLEEFGVDPCEAVYVGDTSVDLETACNAGVDAIIVTWGQGKPDLFGDSRITAVVNDSAELMNAIMLEEQTGKN